MNLTHGSRTLLSQRLRQLADELDSAEQYGVPIPMHVSVSGHEFGSAAFSATEEEFDAWAEYTDATVTDYEHEGSDWSSSEVNVNGLPLHFHVKHGALTA